MCALCYAARRGRDLYTQPATSSPRSDSIKLIFPATALLRSSSFRLGRLLTLFGEFETVFFAVITADPACSASVVDISLTLTLFLQLS